jgi:hypothetical protein
VRCSGVRSAFCRRLATRNLGALCPHPPPLYLGEIIAIVGVALQYLSAWALLLLVLVCAIQLQRIKFEERVLLQVFSDYRDYMARTACLVPGVYQSGGLSCFVLVVEAAFLNFISLFRKIGFHHDFAPSIYKAVDLYYFLGVAAGFRGEECVPHLWL